MSHETIAISGASGALGRLLAELAVREQPAATVILTTRTPDALADLAALGAQVRFADFDEPESLPAAFAGAARLALISASNVVGDRVTQHGAAIDAASAAGVAHILFTSMPRVDEANHPAGHAAREYRATELLLPAAGPAWTVLRNGPYAELNLVERIADSLVGGDLVTNTGDGGMAFVSRIDCAAAAYAVLTQDGHAGMTYDITGPASVSYGDVAALLTEVLGRPIGFRGIDDAEMAARFRSAGVPEEMVEPRVALGRAIRGGFFSAVSPTVEELTGRAGVPVRSVLETHRDTLAAIVAAAA